MSRLQTWTGANPVWQKLNPYERAAAMAIMEAGGGQNSINVLGAMINRSQRTRDPLGDHVSKPIYQPTIERSQEERLGRILQHKDFPQLVNWAMRRESGLEQDPVDGATHFLVPEKQMLALSGGVRMTPKGVRGNSDKYYSWPQWTGYNPETGEYKGVITRDGKHAFLSPDGRYSHPYKGRTEGFAAGALAEAASTIPPVPPGTPAAPAAPKAPPAPGVPGSKDEIGKLITDLEAEGKAPDPQLLAAAAKADQPAEAPRNPTIPKSYGASDEDRARLTALSDEASKYRPEGSQDAIGDFIRAMGGGGPSAENAQGSPGAMLAKALRSFSGADAPQFRPIQLQERFGPPPGVEAVEPGKPIQYQFMKR